MILLCNAMETFRKITTATVNDGKGGITTTYVNGDTFKAVLRYDGATDTTVGESPTSVARYSLITTKENRLPYHTIFKRESNNKVYRTTQDGADAVSPNSASLDMCVVSVEEFEVIV